MLPVEEDHTEEHPFSTDFHLRRHPKLSKAMKGEEFYLSHTRAGTHIHTWVFFKQKIIELQILYF